MQHSANLPSGGPGLILRNNGENIDQSAKETTMLIREAAGIRPSEVTDKYSPAQNAACMRDSEAG